MAVRNLQQDGETLFNRSNTSDSNPITIKTLGCQGYYISRYKGHDGLCCARCHILRKMIYDEKAVMMETPLQLDIFDELLEKYPFIEHARVFCADTESVVYPLREFKGDIDLVDRKLKEHFLYRKSMGVMDRQIDAKQIYYRSNYLPVIMPSPTTEKRDLETIGGNEGVVIDNNVLRVMDADKAFKSGKYMYVINYYQTYELVTGTKPKRVELF